MTDDPLAGETPYPLQEMLGYEITGWGEGWARVEMPIERRHANRYGIPHGGVYATLIDTAAGYAGSWTGESGRKRLAMTLSMTINFIAQPEGDRLIADGRRVGGGRRVFFSEVALKDDAGVLAATGAATLRVRGESG